LKPQDVQNVQSIQDAYDPYSPPQTTAPTSAPTLVNQTILPVDPYSPGMSSQVPPSAPGAIPNVSGAQIQASSVTPLSNEEMERQVLK